ncbi:1,2-dihydroxy-3-keto-5-methylthiopentene dioxygenase [Streptomyces prasinopilosus]|uniref:Acireductone dioxygenase n=2 Tax=Streptomyces prasinopilosus TaxID=67344 RepID=A0A1G6LFX8_9ACTN|nr:1,2-dihydroxy-3-keto-5-methylthiopentene dioxygenase [Streptomyces prasinopilosus]
MPEDAPGTVRVRTDDLDVIHGELLGIGVRLVRWHAARRLPADADDATVMKAYESHIDHLRAEGGHRIVDVVRLTPPRAGTGRGRRTGPAREDFLREHVHDDDLVRFVVAGTGCFSLHVAGQVYAVLCTAGDLLSVPGRTPHWFDAGARPNCTAIRFLQRADGGAVRLLPDGIASRFPTHDDLLASPGG